MKNNQKDCADSQKVEVILNKKYRIIDCRFSEAKVGAYGAVFKTLNIETGQTVAIKKIKRTYGQEGIDCTVLRQNAILKFLEHEHIVTLTESFIENETAYLVFPYFQMNLKQFIFKQYHSKVPSEIIQKIMNQLLSAIKTAHTARFMHRDIKPDNILVEKSKIDPKDFTIKLADWGASRKFNTCTNQNFTQYAITRAYRPPELLFQSRKYSENVDIWSAGCLFYQLLLCELPFPQVSPNQMLVEIMKKVGLQQDDEKWMLSMYVQRNFNFPEQYLKQYREYSLDSVFEQQFGKVTLPCDLLKKMLKINPEKRISASDCLKHPYFDLNN